MGHFGRYQPLCEPVLSLLFCYRRLLAADELLFGLVQPLHAPDCFQSQLSSQILRPRPQLIQSYAQTSQNLPFDTHEEGSSARKHEGESLGEADPSHQYDPSI